MMLRLTFRRLDQTFERHGLTFSSTEGREKHRVGSAETT